MLNNHDVFERISVTWLLSTSLKEWNEKTQNQRENCCLFSLTCVKCKRKINEETQKAEEGHYRTGGDFGKGEEGNRITVFYVCVWKHHNKSRRFFQTIYNNKHFLHLPIFLIFGSKDTFRQNHTNAEHI